MSAIRYRSASLLCRKLAGCLAGSVVWLSLFVAPALAAEGDPPAVEDVLRRLLADRDQIKEAELHVESQRLAVIQQAMQLDNERKRTAKNERENLELRIKAMDLRIQQKEWALRQLEPGQSLLPRSEGVSRRMSQWAESRKRWKRMFIDFPQKSRGAVSSGRALNYFLQVCGPTALEHKIFLEQLQDKARRTELEDDQLTLGKSIEAIRTRQAMIREVSGAKVFTAEQLHDVQLKKGLVGQKLKIRLNHEALPLDWPYVIASNKTFVRYRKSLEASKKNSLDQLRKGDGINVSTQQRLMADTDAISQQFETERAKFYARLRRLVHQKSPDAARASRIAPEWIAAKLFLKDLRGSVARFISARKIQDVEARLDDNPDQTFSVADVLAFLSRHGLRFARADPREEETYQRLFEEMKRYYVDLTAMRVAMQSERQYVDLSRQQADRLMQVELEKFEIPTEESVEVRYSAGGLGLGTKLDLKRLLDRK